MGKEVQSQVGVFAVDRWRLQVWNNGANASDGDATEFIVGGATVEGWDIMGQSTQGRVWVPHVQEVIAVVGCKSKSARSAGDNVFAHRTTVAM